ncbi:MAG: hypothetical protein JWM90_2212 [Thermoleophilia bacterium]|nr:hypothetical protein [Thermoleophilia bacterium]
MQTPARRTRRVVVVLSLIILVGLVLARIAPVPRHEAFDQDRVDACVSLDLVPKSCESLERRSILCDDGHAFCGRAKSAKQRIALCNARRQLHGLGSAPGTPSCTESEAIRELCDDGFEVDLDPLPFGGRCDRYDSRGLQRGPVRSALEYAYGMGLAVLVTAPILMLGSRVMRRRRDEEIQGTGQQETTAERAEDRP